MKKFTFIFVLVIVSSRSLADNYTGAGIGISEACKSLYKPSFSGGDCIHRDMAIRGFVGTDLSDYFAVEGNLDFAFDAGNAAETVFNMILSNSTDGSLNYNNQDAYQTTGRWSVFNFGVNFLGKLPVTRDFVLFAGPSVGIAYTEVDTGVKYFDNQNSVFAKTTYGFGTNYGLTLGFDFFTSRDSAIRLQWQNFRSLDSNAAGSGHFNSNTLTINIRENF